MVAFLAALAVSAMAQQAKVPASYVWWEAESAYSTSFPPPERNPFAPANAKEAEVLSEGKWIGTTGPRTEPLFAEYRVNVPKAGNYAFFVRKFWEHGPFRYRWGDQPWKNVGRQVALLDEAPIRKFLVANWIEAGTVALGAGTTTLRIETTENDGAACFDCFLLIQGPFDARGKLKPDQKTRLAESGWFAFEPGIDPFSPSPIDLRKLNEKVAGERGWIARNGEEFVQGPKKTPVRFWAVNAGPGVIRNSPTSVRYLARKLAKMGVNMVRLHGGVWRQEDPTQIDTAYLDKVHFFVDAMRREGIYSTLSIYFPLWMQPRADSPIKGYNGDKHPFATLFFDPAFQGIYKGWWNELLTKKNPYSGVPMAKDPAVAMLELTNEDSYFFWTFTPYENVPAAQMETLEKLFGAWLVRKYGSLDNAFAAWSPDRVRGDDAPAGRAGFVPLWSMFNNPGQRQKDTAEFLARSQRAFFDQSRVHLKSQLGYRGLVYGSNWTTADPRVLGPLDKWTNAGMDLLDRHGYFDLGHTGDGASYSVQVGHQYLDQSALLFKDANGKENFSLPIMDLRYNDLPSINTEINWTMPNRFRADLPLVAAAYGGLQGSDGVYFFALGGPNWSPTLSKFPWQTPLGLGQMPATALMFRQGMVKPGPFAANVNLPMSDLFALKGQPVSAPLNLDATRAVDVPPGQSAKTDTVASIDPLAFLVGRVQMNFVDQAKPSTVLNTSKLIDRAAKKVRSATGELSWNWGQGLVTIDSPKAQGVTGFLAEMGAQRTRDAVFDVRVPYGAAVLVSLDGQPVRTSKRMLLQLASEERNYGWNAPGGARRTIESVGTTPLNVRQFQGSVQILQGPKRLKVTPLDLNGLPMKPIRVTGKLALAPNVLYYLIER